MTDPGSPYTRGADLLTRMPSMTTEDIAAYVVYHNVQYFLGGNDKIDDTSFDHLVEELRKRAPAHVELTRLW